MHLSHEEYDVTLMGKDLQHICWMCPVSSTAEGLSNES